MDNVHRIVCRGGCVHSEILNKTAIGSNKHGRGVHYTGLKPLRYRVRLRIGRAAFKKKRHKTATGLPKRRQRENQHRAGVGSSVRQTTSGS